MRSHADLDRRSLALHRLIAEKIRREPDLFAKVQTTMQRWKSIVAPSAQPYLQEWQRLFEQGMDRCLELATEDSEHAAALRQSSPFAGILTHKERFKFFKEWSQRNHHETR